MANIDIIEAQTRKERKTFVLFPMKLFAGCKYYVPPLISDELATFSRKKNPSFEHADAKLFLGLKDDEVVGRAAGIISRIANETLKQRDVRFGWFDCVNDYEVAAALFDAIEHWGTEHGLDTISGPMGFNRFDKTGLLVEGFEARPTIAGYYNHPYYNELITRYGFAKEVDYVEYLMRNIHKNGFPPALSAMIERLKDRRRYRILEFSSRRQLLSRASEILDVMDETYADLHGAVPLTEKERAHYVKKFFPFVRRELVKVVVDEQGRMIGFFVAFPSLSEGFQKAKGRLFPFGFVHLRRALGTCNKVVDFYLGGVTKRYRGRGIDLLMAAEMYKSIAELGFEQAESNPELETNARMRAEWKHFEHDLHRRRRLYRKTIGKKTQGTS